MRWRWRGRLPRAGLKAGDHIALLAENRVEWPIVQMACAAMGAVFVPLNTHYRQGRSGLCAEAIGLAGADLLDCSYRSNPYLETVTALRPELPLLDHVFTLEEDYPAMIGEGAWLHARCKLSR